MKRGNETRSIAVLGASGEKTLLDTKRFTPDIAEARGRWKIVGFLAE